MLMMTAGIMTMSSKPDYELRRRVARAIGYAVLRVVSPENPHYALFSPSGEKLGVIFGVNSEEGAWIILGENCPAWECEPTAVLALLSQTMGKVYTEGLRRGHFDVISLLFDGKRWAGGVHMEDQSMGRSSDDADFCRAVCLAIIDYYEEVGDNE